MTTHEHAEGKPTWGPVAAVLVTIGVFLFGQILGYLLFVGLFSFVATIVGSVRYGFGDEWLVFKTNAKLFFDIEGSGLFRLKPWVIFLQLLTITATSLLLLLGFLKYRKASWRLLGFEKPFQP